MLHNALVLLSDDAHASTLEDLIVVLLLDQRRLRIYSLIYTAKVKLRLLLLPIVSDFVQVV